ncbi:hypothetical protein BRD00_12935 [Halobacteriales archaeon QS_8_69_26]|nr:MAG: hypothetical protein BRD00_12935 [Halobacteriales archaeon QS_8_69_26]
MRSFPPVPPIDDAPDSLLSGGHLWIQEELDAGPLRFRLRPDGRIRFGDRDRTFDDGVPPAYRAAASHVRKRLDREALRAAVGDPSSVVFFGGSLHLRRVEYDFDRVPPFLGFDVWDGDRGEFLPPDAVERVYRRLDLRAVDAFQKEVRAVDFDPDRYEFPGSEWYDGPPLGVVVRDKTGNRTAIPNPALSGIEPPEPIEGDADAVVDRTVTEDRIRRAVEDVEARGDTVSVPAVVDRTVATVLREDHARIAGGDRTPDRGELRAAAAERVRRHLDGD